MGLTLFNVNSKRSNNTNLSLPCAKADLSIVDHLHDYKTREIFSFNLSGTKQQDCDVTVLKSRCELLRLVA